MPITCTTVPIDADSTGDRWHITDEDELARLVGLVARCEFGHVETILNGNTAGAITYDAAQEAEIRQKALNALTIPVDAATGKEVRGPAKWHRDGFLFEAISWIAARKSAPQEALLRDPHIGATTQGLDGLMIELNAAKGYSGLSGLTQAARLGCTLLTGNDIHDWFESFNQKVINSL
jgi:hypothetical protein